MKTLSIHLFLIASWLFLLRPPKAEALPSYARQTGLPCSGCHYTPPELNPAGRRFKLLGYVDRADETKIVSVDGSKKTAALALLASLPLSVMLDTSFTSVKSPVPTTQNGSVELPQDISLFLSGAWTNHVGSFLQVTYDTQSDHFSMDNTDIRFAKATKLRGKELVYGLDLNNNLPSKIFGTALPRGDFPGSPATGLRLPMQVQLSMARSLKMLRASAATRCGTTIYISTQHFIARNT